MINVNSSNLLIVGFDGSASAPCGISLPVLYSEDTDRCFKLSPRTSLAEIRRSYPFAEIEKWSRDRLITLLTSRVRLDSNQNDPRVLYISSGFIEYLGCSHPGQLGTDFAWQAVGEDRWATTGDKLTLERFLEDSSNRFLGVSTSALADFFATYRPLNLAKTQDLADLALSASRDPHLRSRIYLRYGAALIHSSTPERIENLFNFIFSPEYPDWTFDAFVEEITRFSKLLKKIFPPDWLKGEINEEQLVQDVRLMSAIEDPEVLELQCQKFASEYPVRDTEHNIVEKIALASRATAELPLDQVSVRLLAREPFFLKSGAITASHNSMDIRFDVIKFVEAMQGDHPGMEPGPIARGLLLSMKNTELESQ
jgi:hypothetical protein